MKDAIKLIIAGILFLFAASQMDAMKRSVSPELKNHLKRELISNGAYEQCVASLDQEDLDEIVKRFYNEQDKSLSNFCEGIITDFKLKNLVRDGTQKTLFPFLNDEF